MSSAKWRPFCLGLNVLNRLLPLGYRHRKHDMAASDKAKVITVTKFPFYQGNNHDDVIKWKHFPRYWPFVRGIHRSPVNSPHKGQWRGALMFSLICLWINGWVNNREAGDLRRYRAHSDVTVMNNHNSMKIIFIAGFQNTLRNIQTIPYLATYYVQFRDWEKKKNVNVIGTTKTKAAYNY